MKPLFFVQIMFVVGCGMIESNHQKHDCDLTEIEATYISLHDHVFTPYCLPCHSSDGSIQKDAGSYNMDTYSNVISIMEAPISADNNHLFESLAPTGTMPLSAEPVPDAAREAIRVWLEAGAPESE